MAWKISLAEISLIALIEIQADPQKPILSWVSSLMPTESCLCIRESAKWSFSFPPLFLWSAQITSSSYIFLQSEIGTLRARHFAFYTGNESARVFFFLKFTQCTQKRHILKKEPEIFQWRLECGQKVSMPGLNAHSTLVRQRNAEPTPALCGTAQFSTDDEIITDE